MKALSQIRELLFIKFIVSLIVSEVSLSFCKTKALLQTCEMLVT